MAELLASSPDVYSFAPYVGRQDPTTQVASRVLCFVVKSQGKTILLDAGVDPPHLIRLRDLLRP